MLQIGLTGGIGSGKSSVADRLVDKGAVLIDADRIVRELQEPGQPVFISMVEAFGPAIVGDDGALNRQAVADRVFNDAEALATLNGLVHPVVMAEIGTRLQALAETDSVVILDIPLLVENDRGGMAAIVVVDVDVDLAVARLVEHRGFAEADARARISRQASRDERIARADVVIDNSGDLAALDQQVDALWERITSGEFGTP